MIGLENEKTTRNNDPSSVPSLFMSFLESWKKKKVLCCMWGTEEIPDPPS